MNSCLKPTQLCNEKEESYINEVDWNIWLQQDEPSGYFSDESDEDIPEELKKDFVDENVGDSLPVR